MAALHNSEPAATGLTNLPGLLGSDMTYKLQPEPLYDTQSRSTSEEREIPEKMLKLKPSKRLVLNSLSSETKQICPELLVQKDF